MRRNISILLFGVIILTAGFNMLLAAPSGIIVGKITDSITGKPLPGANIYIEGTGIGAASDLRGEYLILQAPSGSQNLIVTYIGYKDKITSVNIDPDKKKEIDIQLTLDVLEGETIVVTAQMEGQAAAINQQLQSNTIKNIVSSERIMEVPDANAAESIGRLPGISVTRSGGEANQVVIRGLAPAYNNIAIDGELIPATSLGNRAVDLNMISPTVLSAIEVTKALTSDMDASAFGGTVNLVLRDAPSGFKYNFRILGGNNNLRSDWNQYKAYFTLSNRFAGDKFGLMVTGDQERVQRGSDRLTSNWFPIHNDRLAEGDPPLYAWAPTLQYSNEQRDRSSFSVFMDYRLSNGLLKFSNLVSRLERNEKLTNYTFNNDLNYFSPSYRERIRQIDVLSNSLAGEHYFGFGELDWRVSRLSSSTRHPSDLNFVFREENALDMADLVGTGYYSPADLIATAKRDLSNTGLFNVNERFEKSIEQNLAAQINFKLPYTLTSSMAGYIKLGGKVLDKTRERDRSRLRIGSWSIGNDNINPDGSQLEFYHSQYGTPGFEFPRVITGQPAIANYMDPNFDGGDFLNGQYPFFDLGFNRDELMRMYDLYLKDNLAMPRFVEDLEDYEIEERVSAAYIMTELNIGQIAMLMPGVRFEYTENDLTGRIGSFPTEDFLPDPADSRIRDTTAVRWYGNWFPMLQLRVRPVDWFDIRLAYTESISRPRHAWLLPNISIGSGTYRKGNPDIKPQLSTNYDLFLSFYGNKIGLLTMGAFHKDIDNLVYRRGNHLLINEAEAIKYGIPPQYKGLFLTIPENVPFRTRLDGFEFEWQANFRWLPSPFDGLVFSVNYTHIWSETKYPKSVIVTEELPTFPFIKKTIVDSFRVGKMINQPDVIFNVSIGYDKGPFSARVSTLFQGRTLRGIGDLPREDSYTEELFRTDISARYRITDNFSLFINLNNLTNEPDESFQVYEEWPRLFPTAIEYYGWTLDFGIGISN